MGWWGSTVGSPRGWERLCRHRAMEYFREKHRSRDETGYCRVQGCASRLAALSAVSRVHWLKPAALGKDPSASRGHKTNPSVLHHLGSQENSLSCSTGRFSQRSGRTVVCRAAQRGLSIALALAGACSLSDTPGLAAAGGLDPIPGLGCGRGGYQKDSGRRDLPAAGSTGPGSHWRLPQLCSRSWHHLHPSKGEC